MDNMKARKRLNRKHSYRVKRNRIQLLKDLRWTDEVISKVKGHDKHHPINCGRSKCGVCGKSIKRYIRKSDRRRMRLEDNKIRA